MFGKPHCERAFLYWLNQICITAVSPWLRKVEQETSLERQRLQYWPDSSLNLMTCIFTVLCYQDLTYLD